MAEITSMAPDSDGVIPWQGKDRAYRVKNRLDFSETGALTTDTVVVFEVAAKQLLVGMSVEVITAEGGTATIDIGLTGGDVDKFIDGADINAAVGTFKKSGDAGTKEVIVAEGGHMFATADNIDLLPLNDLDAAIIDVCAWFIDLS